jgi:hypothetical protein
VISITDEDSSGEEDSEEELSDDEEVVIKELSTLSLCELDEEFSPPPQAEKAAPKQIKKRGNKNFFIINPPYRKLKNKKKALD